MSTNINYNLNLGHFSDFDKFYFCFEKEFLTENFLTKIISLLKKVKLFYGILEKG
jgi:hypothetical protein